MYLQPDCVNLQVYANRDIDHLIGVGGDDPRYAASRELGEAACDDIVSGMVTRAKMLVEESREQYCH